MNKELPKIKEFSKEEIIKQFDTKEIDIDFMAEYISKRDKVYNKLIDEVNNLGQALNEIKEFIYRNRKAYNNYVGFEKDWLYIKDKDILEIINKILGGSD